MKKVIYSLALLGLTTQFKAADLTVQENGPVGTYASITSAITAATDGDRIIIHPKVGQNAWVENITINKSLELVSSEDTVRYKIDGYINVVGATGRTVIIASAELTTGDILGSSASGWRTNVSIFNCIIRGTIFFNNSYEVLVSGSLVNQGNIIIHSGEVIGNEVNNGYLQIRKGTIAADSVNVIGNKLVRVSLTTSNAVYLTNNFIKESNSLYGSQILIFINSTVDKPSKLTLKNNTLVQVYGDDNADSFIGSNSTISLNLISSNNVFVGYRHPSNSSTYNLLPLPTIRIGTGISSYNYFYYTSGVFNNGSTSDLVLNSMPISLSTGESLSGSGIVDMADPSFEYYDLDLTRGDAGCYGGSYSLDNYFPITGSSRVFSVDMPFGLTTGGTLNIKAKGFDR